VAEDIKEFDISLLRKSIQFGVNEVVQQLERKREQVALEQIDADSFLTTLDKACSILKKLEKREPKEKEVEEEKDPVKIKAGKQIGYSTRKYLAKTA